MYPSRILVISVLPDPPETLQALFPPGYQIDVLHSLAGLEIALQRLDDLALVVVDLGLVPDASAQRALLHLMDRLPLVLLVKGDSESARLQANRLMVETIVLALIALPIEAERDQSVIKRALERFESLAQRRRLEQDLGEANRRLNQRLQEINTIYTVGKSVASSLNLDDVLARVVDTSVNFTQAEEGFILLHEDNRLYLRVSKNLSENLVQRFNVEAADPIAWQVISSGRPAMLKRDIRIATGYLVRALLYLPLRAPGRGVVGVLGVVNRRREDPFSEEQLFTLSSLADFAAIAVENAQLFSSITAEKSRLQAILEHATEVLLITDSDNRLLVWSQMAGETFGIPQEAQGQPIETVITNEKVLELFERSGPETSLAHAEIPLADEHTFNAQLTVAEGLGRVVVMQDITHLKELDRLKSEFVSTVSHDLRTPLTTVQGYIELLDRVGPLNATQQGFVKKALNSLSHITLLISDLLDIGRIEAGYDLEMRPCRINDCITQTVESLLDTAAQHEVTLRVGTVAEGLWVKGNPYRLRQVLDNLINNAIKYNRPNGWIEVRAQRDEDHIVVQVQDNGIGIPTEEQPRVFDRFYRVVTEETEQIRGSGLGLAIVKSIVEKHKGRAWVESTPGKGSTFSFILPALEQTGITQEK